MTGSKTLLITATALEAAPLRDALPWRPLPCALGELLELPERAVYLAHLGVAKVNTAAGLALILNRLKPEQVIQFGIAGAFAEADLEPGQLAVATQDTHMDTGVSLENGWQDMAALGFPLLGDRYNTFSTDAALSKRLEAVTGAQPHPFGTSETVTGSFAHASVLYGRFGVAVESMEGAAAAQVCAAFGIPFAELRGVSNVVGERDKAQWTIGAAVGAVNRAVLAYLRTAHEVVGDRNE